MLSVSGLRPLNRTTTIQPGPQASVGDVIMGQKLKSTYPGNFREGLNYGDPRVGSTAQDGDFKNKFSGGGAARTIDKAWTGERAFKTCTGWIQQDIRAPDKLLEPMMGALPQYSWLNKVSRIETMQGDLFPAHPDGLIVRDNGPPRGGMYPRVMGVESGQAPPVEGTQNRVLYRDQLNERVPINRIGRFRDRDLNRMI